MKIWSLFKHENLTTDNKIGAISPPFHNSFNISLISDYIFICEMWLFDLCFLSYANLICRGTDILKHSSPVDFEITRVDCRYLNYRNQSRVKYIHIYAYAETNTVCFLVQKLQSTLVISKSKELSEILRDIRTSTYQSCRIEEKK